MEQTTRRGPFREVAYFWKAGFRGPRTFRLGRRDKPGGLYSAGQPQAEGRQRPEKAADSSVGRGEVSGNNVSSQDRTFWVPGSFEAHVR